MPCSQKLDGDVVKGCHFWRVNWRLANNKEMSCDFSLYAQCASIFLRMR